MQETKETGVIYMLTNIINNKKYIGKAKSFRTNNKKHGALGRYLDHCSYALQGSIDVPLLYEDMRQNGTEIFIVSTLEVCLIPNLDEREKFHIIEQESYKNETGYNYFVGNNKPIDPAHKKHYETQKVNANKHRAVGGALRRSDDTSTLPPNIYKRKAGLFAQIKLQNTTGDSTLYNKAFFMKTDTDEVKLQKAQAWLASIKLQHQATL